MKSREFYEGDKAVEKRSERITHADRVLRYLQQQDRPISAYDILEGLRFDGVTASTTVYRALEKLLNAGRIHKVESLNAWTVCCGEHDQQVPVFAICDDCGTVTEHIDTARTSPKGYHAPRPSSHQATHSWFRQFMYTLYNVSSEQER